MNKNWCEHVMLYVRVGRRNIFIPATQSELADAGVEIGEGLEMVPHLNAAVLADFLRLSSFDV